MAWSSSGPTDSGINRHGLEHLQRLPKTHDSLQQRLFCPRYSKFGLRGIMSQQSSHSSILAPYKVTHSSPGGHGAVNALPITAGQDGSERRIEMELAVRSTRYHVQHYVRNRLAEATNGKPRCSGPGETLQVGIVPFTNVGPTKVWPTSRCRQDYMAGPRRRLERPHVPLRKGISSRYIMATCLQKWAKSYLVQTNYENEVV